MPSTRTGTRQQPNRQKCLVEGCELPNHSLGLCGTHMEKKPSKRRVGRTPCIFDGCDGPNHAHGLCHAHVMQQRRGVELRAIRPPKPTADEGMLWCGTCKQFRDEIEFGIDTARAQPKRTCRPCSADRQRAYTTRNRERVNLNRRLGVRGITKADYLALMERQSGACAICKRGDRPLDIDHAHDSGAVRGLLCGPCNRGIGFLDDDVELMRSAIVYLLGA